MFQSPIGLTAAMSLALVAFQFAPAVGRAEEHVAPDAAWLLRQCSLVAHVRVAGETPRPGRGDETIYFVEVLQAALGGKPGHLVMLASHAEDSDERLACRVGEEFVLLARRKANGLLEAVGGARGKWPIAKDGRPLEHQPLSGLAGGKRPDSTAALLSRLRELVKRFDFQVSLVPFADDATAFEPGKPLRVKLVIDNVGREPLSLENDIDYEFFTARMHLVEQMKRLEAAESLRVKVYAEPLDLRQLDAMQHELERRSIAMRLDAGQRCEAVYDLGGEEGIGSSGRLRLWVELGGRASQPVEVRLPRIEERVEAIEELAKLAEWDDSPGPFVKVAAPPRNMPTMPRATLPEEDEILRLVLSDWLSRSLRDGGKEAFLLSPDNLPAGCGPRVENAAWVVGDWAVWRTPEPVKLRTSAGEYIFRWQAVRVEKLEINGSEATVQIVRPEGERASSGATYQLRRRGGRWQLSAESQRWAS